MKYKSHLNRLTIGFRGASSFTFSNFLQDIMFYSTESNIKPKVLYLNAKIEKNRMIKENKSKRAIYR